MSIIQAVILGIVQGLTEFLPVSSSGHLVIAQTLLGVDAPGITFEILVHLATALAIYAAYFTDVNRLVLSVVRFITNPRSQRVRTDPELHLAALLITGSIPAAIAAFLFADRVTALFSSVTVVGAALFVTAGLLFAAGRARGRSIVSRLRGRESLLIGSFQALALIPGISRSGSTISSGLMLGLDRREAARFSFLLAMPAILGAAAVDMLGGGSLGAIGFLPAAAGFFAAAVSGYAAILLLVRVLKQGRLHCFAWYCLLAGAFAIVCGLKLTEAGGN